jgi:hypothetical protein
MHTIYTYIDSHLWMTQLTQEKKELVPKERK